MNSNAILQGSSIVFDAHDSSIAYVLLKDLKNDQPPPMPKPSETYYLLFASKEKYTAFKLMLLEMLCFNVQCANELIKGGVVN